MVEDMEVENSPEGTCGWWIDFPNAIRRAAWEIAQIECELQERQIQMFKQLMVVMRDGDSRGVNTPSFLMKESLTRARVLMDDYAQATRQHGWIDMPLTGKEPYMDGTFPEPDEDLEEEQSEMKMEEDTVDNREVKEEDTVVKKEIKEEVEDEEILMPSVLPQQEQQRPEKIKEEETNEVIPIKDYGRMKKQEEEEESVEMSTRDYAQYLDAASAETINGTNFTLAEKCSIKVAIQDMLFKGLTTREAGDKYCVATQRLIAFSFRTKQVCRRMKRQEQSGVVAQPSTSREELCSSRPFPSASNEEKLEYVNKYLDSIVGGCTLNPKGRELLKSAVRLVVWDGISMAASSSRTGVPSSTMFPYVSKSRKHLVGIVKPPPPTYKDNDRTNKLAIRYNEAMKKRSERRGEATVDEITYIVNEVLDMSRIEKSRREMIYMTLVEILTGAFSPGEACKKRNLSLSSVASYLARVRGRIGDRLPKQLEDPKPPVKEPEEKYPYEKGTVVLNGHRLPNSVIEICKMIDNGSLSHVQARPFEGTRAEFKAKLQRIVTRFRYPPCHRLLADALLRMLVDQITTYEAANEFDLPPSKLGGWSKVVRMMIDMNSLTMVEEDGTKRIIPPREKYELGRYCFWRRKFKKEKDDKDEDEEDDDEEEEEEENEENEDEMEEEK